MGKFSNIKALTLRVKNWVGSRFKQVSKTETTPNQETFDIKMILLNLPDEEITAESEQSNAIHLAAAEEIKGRRRNFQKPRKAAKWAFISGTAKTRQKVDNMCWAGRQRHQEEVPNIVRMKRKPDPFELCRVSSGYWSVYQPDNNDFSRSVSCTKHWYEVRTKTARPQDKKTTSFKSLVVEDTEWAYHTMRSAL